MHLTRNLRTAALMTVVVFNRRAHQFVPTPNPELALGTTFNPGLPSVSVTVPTGFPRPDVQKGGWVMDGTINNAAPGGPVRHAKFYRVVGVTSLLLSARSPAMEGGCACRRSTRIRIRPRGLRFRNVGADHRCARARACQGPP